VGRVYATAADWQASGRPVDDTIGPLLTRASQFLDAQVFRHSFYDADATTGMPTDSTVAAAFRDCAIAQVEWWQAVGEAIGIGGVGTYGTVRIGTAHLQDPVVGGQGASAARQVAPTVWDILQNPDLGGTQRLFHLDAVTSW
jgi:hypothetical protein